MTHQDPPEYDGFVLSGPRRGAAVSGDTLGAALENAELAWVHLPFDPAEPAAAIAWMARHVPGLDETTRHALTAEMTRPRAVAAGAGLMLVLRGINLNAGQDPEDMVSCRVYIDARRIVTLARRPVKSIDTLTGAVAGGQGPATPGGFLHDLALSIVAHVETVLDRLEDETDALEDRMDLAGLDRAGASCTRLTAAGLRRQILALRRHMAPQRDALATAMIQARDLFTKSDHRRLIEVQDRYQRAVEELDTLAGRLTLVRDEIRAAQDERTNRNLYILSVLSALFLPLGFLTGLLGVNLGGIPLADDPRGFGVFVGLLAAVVIVQVIVLRRLRRL